jgi:GT2 family glycosyltransferase
MRKTKEGNLSFFMIFGYDNYLLFSWMDHVPEIGYLEEMLRPFADSEVGYVAAVYLR